MSGAIKIPFFGRSKELAELGKRCARSGVTIVRGPPRIGKSTLLREFRDRCRRDSSRRIGFIDAEQASGDALLRALKDAYTLWLSEANGLEQIRSIHEQMKGDYCRTVGVAFGKALASLTGPGKVFIDPFFDGLGEAQKKLKDGGVELPRLTSEEAKDLLRILAHGQHATVVIILNQWEHGQDLSRDEATIRNFLENAAGWPSVHMVLHLREPRYPARPNPEARSIAEEMVGDFPAADWLDVGPLNFEDEPESQAAMIRWVREQFPGFRRVPNSEIMEEFRGEPSVLDEWSNLDAPERDLIGRLRDVASHARVRSSPEIKEAYEQLLNECAQGPSDTLEVALLAAVLPLPGDPQVEEAILPAILGTAERSVLQRLESMDLLRPQGNSPLSFGHVTRQEAAYRCILGRSGELERSSQGLCSRLRPYLRHALNRSIPALVNLWSAQDWARLDRGVADVALILTRLVIKQRVLVADRRSQILCSAAATLFIDVDCALIAAGVGGRNELKTDSERAVAAIGFANSVAKYGTEFERADDLLNELRGLAKTQSDEPVTVGLLARGLVNAYENAPFNTERAWKLFDELRGLMHAYSENPAVGKAVAWCLVKAIDASGSDVSMADEYLRDLRFVVQVHSDEPGAPDVLASGLVQAVSQAGSDFVRADAILEELRALARENPQESGLREDLMVALRLAILNAGNDFRRADVLLGELRRIADEHPLEWQLRGQLSMGLLNGIYNSAGDFERCELLLNEQRKLATEHPQESTLWESLATGLNNAIAHSRSDIAREDDLLIELRQLERDHIDKQAVREQFANALFNAFNHSEPKSHRARDYLAELRALVRSYPNESSLPTRLAMALVNSIDRAGNDGLRADRLLRELRDVAKKYSDQGTIWASLLRGYGVRIPAVREDALVVGRLMRDAASVLGKCPKNDETKEVSDSIASNVQEARGHADSPGKQAIDEAKDVFRRVYRTKWPEEED